MSLEILKKMGLVTVMVAFVGVGVIACDDENSNDAVLGGCDTVTCGANSQCIEVGDEAQCQCVDGYELDGFVCVKEDTAIAKLTDVCEGEDCSGNGECVEKNGKATCDCDEGYVADELTCELKKTDVTKTDVCKDVTCSGEGTCNGDTGVPVCTCKEGFIANGTDCIAVKTCADATCDTCLDDFFGTAKCLCPADQQATVELTCEAYTPACYGVDTYVIAEPAFTNEETDEVTVVAFGDELGIRFNSGIRGNTLIVKIAGQDVDINKIQNISDADVVFVAVPAGIFGASLPVSIKTDCHDGDLDSTLTITVEEGHLCSSKECSDHSYCTVVEDAAVCECLPGFEMPAVSTTEKSDTIDICTEITETEE